MLKKTLFFTFAIGLSLNLAAQETTAVEIDGAVKNKQTIGLSDLKNFPSHSLDSLTIFNHLMQKKSVIRNIKGVWLRDVLAGVEINSPNATLLSEFFIVCTASDNYKVVFSWNEVFNTKDGGRIMLLTHFEPDPAKTPRGDMAMLAPNDLATGRRFVKGLRNITIIQVN